jgi:hypothetical protein
MVLLRRSVPDDLRQMAERGHVALAELLRQPRVRLCIEPLMPVELAIHEEDPMADRAGALELPDAYELGE